MKQKYIKIVKYFNYLVKKTLLKKQNKTNTNLKISNFNKYIIALISFLFLYLFYLSIPTLYDKAWVQKSLENKLLDDFNINFSMSSDISYNILPSPHFLVKNSKIFRKDLKKPTALSEIKNLKIFISQKKLYDKSKVNITEVIIDNANFSLNKNDIKLLNKLSKKRFSNKKINIRKSNIFFKDELDETIAIIKVPKGVYFYNELKLLNLFNFNGEAFNIPFSFELNNQTEYPYNKEININTKKLKLNIINQSMQESNQIVSGLNTTSFLNSKIDF